MVENRVKLKVKIRRRKVDEKSSLPENLPPLLRRLYASRGVRNIEDVGRSTRRMLPWQGLSGIEEAVKILHEALYKKTKITVVGDFDADGASGTALSVLVLKALGSNNIAYLIPNRFKDGYGLTPEIVDQAHTNGAQVIMTVDNGMSSYEGVNYANQLGISVVVTDHHLPGDILPPARAIVNPNLQNCNFPSKALSGAGVAFYLMAALRASLSDQEWFRKRCTSVPNLADYLDLVVLGTVIDVVPFDVNNRILIWQGLNRIRAGKCRPGIKALLKVANCNPKKLVESDLSFSLGPRLNAAGRLSDMSIGVALLLCENQDEALVLAYELDALNSSRKKIEKKMQTKALSLCKTPQKSKTEFSNGIVIYHPDWHQGIIGILASRIKERFYRPVVAFAPSGSGILKGSCRSIHGLHIHNLLEQLNTLYPGLILKFGGHAMAAGLSLEEKRLKEFQLYFTKIVNEQIGPELLQNEVISDGPLLPNEMTIEVAQMLRYGGPWGQMFPEPLFDGHFYLLEQRLIRKKHLKVTIKSVDGEKTLNGIVFNVDTAYWPNKNIYKVEMVYKLDVNEFRGNQNLQLIISNIWPI